MNEDNQKPAFFYVLMAFLTFLLSFIGFNFGGAVGTIFGFLLSCVVNGYALRIKLD